MTPATERTHFLAAGRAKVAPSAPLCAALSAAFSTTALATALLSVVTIAATYSGYSFLAAHVPDRFLIGLLGPEGAGANLIHLGCYTRLATDSGRRMVMVPEYSSPHYEGHAPVGHC